jgi:hypothetical protein
LWITQNIIAAGSKPMNILMSQELLKNCLHILNNSVDLEKDAVVLLDLIVDGKWTELALYDKQEIQKNVLSLLKKRYHDALALQILYKIVANEGCWNSSQTDTSEIINMMSMNLIEAATPNEESEQVVHISIKILELAFKADQENVAQSLKFIVQHEVKLSDIINKSAVTPKYYSLARELINFLASLSTFQHPSVTQYFAIDPPENLRIPKLFEF